jgi:NAD(P)-dependent dehydrogenase (short-subunit alcohol dehydrogenase family)
VVGAGLALGRDDAHVVSEEDVDAMIDTNVKGLVRVTRAVVPGMIGRNRGHIINISRYPRPSFLASPPPTQASLALLAGPYGTLWMDVRARACVRA